MQSKWNGEIIQSRERNVGERNGNVIRKRGPLPDRTRTLAAAAAAFTVHLTPNRRKIGNYKTRTLLKKHYSTSWRADRSAGDVKSSRFGALKLSESPGWLMASDIFTSTLPRFRFFACGSCWERRNSFLCQFIRNVMGGSLSLSSPPSLPPSLSGISQKWISSRFPEVTLGAIYRARIKHGSCLGSNLKP